MLFYCEKNTRNKVTVFDVLKLDDLKSWWEQIAQDQQWIEQDMRSLLNINNLSYQPYKGPREGHWYDIPIEFWKGFSVIPESFNEVINNFSDTDFNGDLGDYSLIYRAVLHAPNSKLNFSQYAVSQPDITDSIKSHIIASFDSNLSKINIPPLNGPLTIIARGVGQGNWNEICSNDARIIYDTGADNTWGLTRLRQLINRVMAAYVTNTHVILSHWDTDHYHAILGMGLRDLQTIETFSAPSQFPGNSTSVRVWNHLVSGGIQPKLIPPAPSTGTNRVIALVYIGTIEYIDFYRATTGMSKNQTGIVLLVKGPSANGFLTGDHHYDKIFNYIVSGTVTQGKELVMVIPHHGGNAGRINVVDWSRVNNPTGLLSYGPGNGFGHPNNNVLTSLRMANFKFYHTRGTNDQLSTI